MASTDDFAIASQRLDACVTVEVVGELDLDTAPELRRSLTDATSAGAATVVVDLARVGFVDSVGLGTLVAVWKEARTFGAEFVVWRPSFAVARALGLTALDQVLTIDVAAGRHPVHGVAVA